MKGAELKVVRFDNQDVIATSGGMEGVVTMLNAFNDNTEEKFHTYQLEVGYLNNATHHSQDITDIITDDGGLKNFIDMMYGANGERYSSQANDMYDKVRNAKFIYNGGGYANIVKDDNYLWIDRNGDGVYDSKVDKLLTVEDVINSTTGTEAAIKITNALKENGNQKFTTGLNQYTDEGRESVDAQDGDVGEGNVLTDTFMAKGIPGEISYNKGVFNISSIEEMDPTLPDNQGAIAKLTYSTDGESPANLTYLLKPTYFLTGKQSEAAQSTQAGQVHSLADLFSKTVWTFNDDGNGGYEFTNNPNVDIKNLPTD